jgi:NAD(P)-dependent dehydrogenase (short-subunit alcohol dehydrogenase family)
VTATGRLDGKVAIVTGAGRGIGEAIARRFAAEGATVVLAQRTAADGERVAAAIAAAGGRARPVVADVREESSVADLVAGTLADEGRVDVLCANAGVGFRGSVVDTSTADWDGVMDANARGVWLCLKYGIPPMVAQGGGSVVVVASVASFVAFPVDAAYCASKGAALMLTRQAALDFAKQNVRVNAVCPGFIETPMLHRYCAVQSDPAAAMAEVLALHPMGRLGLPDDVASAALFFASDEARWVTGAHLAVDGGLLTMP